MAQTNNAVFQEAEKFLSDRVSLPDKRFLLPMVLWAAHTYCWRECQFALPYLGFTGVSGSGKNRAMSLVGALSNNYYMPTVITPAALRDDIHEMEPTLGVEECEKELLTHNSLLHRIFNGGYMPGSHWDKVMGGNTVRLSIYCPKMFTAIGDPEISLRGRCIMVPMSVGQPAVDDEPQVFEAVGKRIGRKLLATVIVRAEEIADVYRRPNYFQVPRTQVGRNFQILKPLWSICAVVLPERLAELQRISTYIMSMKDRPICTVPDMRLRKENDELGQRCLWLLEDAAEAAKSWSGKNIRSSELIQLVLKLRDGYWQGYQYEDTKGIGIGIGDKNGAGVFAKMLSLATDGKVKPEIRYMAPKQSAHGYSVAEIQEAAAAVLGGNEPQAPEPPTTQEPEKPDFTYLSRLTGADLRHAKTILTALHTKPWTECTTLKIPKLMKKVGMLETTGYLETRDGVGWYLTPAYLQYERETAEEEARKAEQLRQDYLQRTGRQALAKEPEPDIPGMCAPLPFHWESGEFYDWIMEHPMLRPMRQKYEYSVVWWDRTYNIVEKLAAHQAGLTNRELMEMLKLSYQQVVTLTGELQQHHVVKTDAVRRGRSSVMRLTDKFLNYKAKAA